MLLIKRFWHPVNILPVPKPIGIVDVGAAYMQCSEAVLNENHGLFVRLRRINCSYHMLEHGVRLFEKKQNLIQGYLHSLICRKIVLSAQCSVLSAQCSVLSAQCSVLSAQCSKVFQTLRKYEANRLVRLPIQWAFAEHIHHLMLCIMLQFLQRYA
jgi:hypothetical protein